MPFLTVEAIIGNEAFQNGRCHICFSICFSLGLDRVETAHDLLLEYNVPNALMFIFTLLCLRLAFIWWLGQLYHWYLRKSRLIIKFCGDLADQPSIYKRDVTNQRFRVRCWVLTYLFSIFLSQKMQSLVYESETCLSETFPFEGTKNLGRSDIPTRPCYYACCPVW